MATERQKAIAKGLTLLIPGAPWSDAEAIREAAASRHMKMLPPSVALWLATVARVRHEHTEYDALLAEGYDRDSARHFVIDDINRVLTGWRATRLLTEDDEDA
ncbi:MAG: DUF2293 domain-containing protein [Mesorhizobium sp.]